MLELRPLAVPDTASLFFNALPPGDGSHAFVALGAPAVVAALWRARSVMVRRRWR